MREGIAVGGMQQKSRVKSKLMIGAAGLAAAGVSTAAVAAGAAPAAAADKWLPYASVGGQVGDQVTGAQVHLFVPVWQDLNSLLFVRLGIGTQTRDKEVANFGLGYRTHVDPDWIVGIYGGFDSTRTKYGHTFSQGSVGAELMSADWDVRINGYLATKNEVRRSPANMRSTSTTRTSRSCRGRKAPIPASTAKSAIASSAPTIWMCVCSPAASASPAPTPAPPRWGRPSISDFRDIAGPMGRAEVDIYDIDALGAQSRVTVTGQISHDDLRGTTGYVGASLRIPLGAGWGQGGQALDELDRRMVDPVRRQDNVLTQWQYSKPEPVIIYNGTITSHPTNTLYYLDNTAGAGTYADPTTLQDATTRAATNGFIVATDFDGPIVATGTTVYGGQTLVGPGTFNVRGAISTRVFSHDFAPGSGTPTFAAASATDNIITLRSQFDHFWHHDLSGPFNAASTATTSPMF